MKVHLRIKNEKEVMKQMERANELLKELGEIFQGYSGLGRGLEVEVVPAQDEAQTHELNSPEEKR